MQADVPPYFLSKRRKKRILKFLKRTSIATEAGANIRSVIEGFQDLDSLIAWMDSNSDWKIAQRVLFIVATTGTITPEEVNKLRARNPLLSCNPQHPQYQQGGVYIHITTIKKRDGKLVTHIYVGSTRAGMIRVGSCRPGQVGFPKRTAKYTRFDTLHQQGDFDLEDYVVRRKELAGHANHWPQNDQDEVINDVWITAFSLDVPEIYAATCGGDERAGTDLMALWKSCSTNPRIKPLDKLGVGVFFFLEAFTMLFTGFGDRHGKNGGQVKCIEDEYKQDMRGGNSSEDRIWMAHPPGYQMLSSNSRLQLFEFDGHDRKDGTKYNLEFKSYEDIPRTLVEIHGFIKLRKAWTPLPTHPDKLEKLLLPSQPHLDTDSQRSTAKAILTQLEFDATGKSKKISVDANKSVLGAQVFKFNRNDKWISLVGVALTRDHPDCLDDSASYQPQAENLRNSSNNADLWIPRRTREKITHYDIVVDQLDSHGLIPVTLTGVTVRYYERNAGEPSRTVTRAVGEKDGAGNELTGPQYDMLARIAAILRIALAFERAAGLQLGLGVFFQKPPAIPLTIIDVDAEDDEGPVSSVSQESFDLGMREVVEALAHKFSGFYLDPPFYWDWPTYGTIESVNSSQVSWRARDQPLVRIEEAGSYGYLLVPRLPTLSSDSRTNAYAEALIYGHDCLYEVPHPEQDGGDMMLRLVAPIVEQTWIQEDKVNHSLLQHLPCGMYMHRLVKDESFFTVLIDTPGNVHPPDVLLQGYLEQTSFEGDLDVYSEEGWTFCPTRVTHPYPGTMAYFKDKSLPETLILITCFPSNARNTKCPKRYFERVKLPVVLPPTTRTLGDEEIISYLGRVVGGEKLSSEALSLLVQSLISAATFTNGDHISYDMVALAALFDKMAKPDGQLSPQKLPKQLLLGAITAAATLSWSDVGRQLCKSLMILFQFSDEDRVPAQQGQPLPLFTAESADVASLLHWEEATLLACMDLNLKTLDFAEIGTALCTVREPVFWNAFEVSRQASETIADHVLVNCSGICLYDRDRDRVTEVYIKEWVGDIQYVEVLNAAGGNGEPKVIIYKLDDQAVMRPARTLHPIKAPAARLFSIMKRWIPDVRWVDVPGNSSHGTGQFLPSESSQGDSQGASAIRGFSPMRIDDHDDSIPIGQMDAEVEPGSLPIAAQNKGRESGLGMRSYSPTFTGSGYEGRTGDIDTDEETDEETDDEELDRHLDPSQAPRRVGKRRELANASMAAGQAAGVHGGHGFDYPIEIEDDYPIEIEDDYPIEIEDD